MAKRRTLKKKISFVAGELFAECVAMQTYTPNMDTKATTDVMMRILQLDNDFICRVNHTEPGNAKFYFAQLQKDFNEQVTEIIDIIGNLA